MRNHPRGVIEKGDQIGFLLATSGFDDGRAVHHIAHPQLSGLLVGKSSPVLTSAVGSGMTHQAVLFEQPVHVGYRERFSAADHALISQLPDDQADRQIRIAFLDLQQAFGHRRGQRPWMPGINTSLRLERIEATGAIVAQPVAQRALGHTGSHRAGNLVLARCDPGEFALALLRG